MKEERIFKERILHRARERTTRQAMDSHCLIMKKRALHGHFQAFREVTLLLTRHRQLTFEMARREVTERYLGQVFGAFWVFAHPLVLMGVYIFIFAFVFKVKIGGTYDLPLNYTIYLLSGLIPWLGVQESMSKGTTAITANANLVKQVVFPIEILPVKGVIASLFTQVVFLVFLIGYVLISYRLLPWTYALLPLLLFFQALGMIGINYFLSSISPYFRDLKDFVQVFVVIGVYLVPAFYLPEFVPELFRPLLYLNPFSYLIWCYQDVLYFGRIDHSFAWVVFPFLALLSFYGGYRVFRKLKIMFGNVL
ncbi:MAG: ABC transporter permease [Candidatus Eremiobacteraeota bacterium]|nr:ABC transporter permease [Candidatus Eremiobacteraeota bacterium]